MKNKIKTLIQKTSIILNNVYKLMHQNNYLSFVSVFLFFLTVFSFVYLGMGTLVSADDHYFHFRFAERLVSDGFLNSFYNFKSLYFTNITQGGHFIYYNFLFYLVVIPFTLITPLFFAIKIYALFILALIGSTLYWFIKKLGIKYSFLFTILFFSIIGDSSLVRLFLSRPFVFAPIFILLIILAIYKKKYFAIFTITFLYLFWHTATFFIPLIVGFVYFIVYSLYERKYDYKPLLYVFFGTISALVVVNLIDDGFFTYLYDNIISVIKSITTGEKINIAEGGELYKRNLFDYFSQNLILFILYIGSIIVHFGIYIKERKNLFVLDEKTKQKRILTMVFFFVSALFFVAITNISYRFSDFFVFMGFVFIVLVINQILPFIDIKKIDIKKGIKYAIIICITFLFINNLLRINDGFATASKPDDFSKVGTYLSNHLKEGEIVMNLDWSWFPQLYYYAPKQNYIIGLEPKLTYLHDQRIYWLWSSVGAGMVCETEKCPEKNTEVQNIIKEPDLLKRYFKSEGDKIAKIVVNEFHSHYIVSSANYSFLNKIMDNNKHFKKVIDDKGRYFVYKIID